MTTNGNANTGSLPPFDFENMRSWFKALDKIFNAGQVNERVRFSRAVAKLDDRATVMAQTIIKDYRRYPNPYYSLKDVLLRKAKKGKYERLDTALNMKMVGSQRPSTYVQQLDSVLAGITMDDLKTYLLKNAAPSNESFMLRHGEKARLLAARIDSRPCWEVEDNGE